ncbi:NADP-dependent oxidoreductase [Spirosoma knui]
MKAIILKEAGGVENLIVTELARPTIHDDEVLIQTKAISINPIDAVVRNNTEFLKFMLKLEEGEQPVILGWDISGVVVAVGSHVTRFNVGDEVFGGIKFPGHGKGYAEYVAAPTSQLAFKPKNISHQESAAASMAALTAYQSLVKYAHVKTDDKVLIHAAAGGVGHYAVQIAKHLGAYVIGTASAANKDFLLQLGVDEFIDYKTQKFEHIVTDADVVVDSVTMDGAHIERSLKALKNGGRLISLLAFFDEVFIEKMKAKNVYGHRLSVRSNGDDMNVLAQWLEQGVLKSHVSKLYSFEQLAKAHSQIETGKTKGKIVVKL